MPPPRSDDSPRPPAAEPGTAAADDFAGLTPEVYRELRRAAAGALGRERRDHTLQPTALVHEAFLRLAGQRSPWQGRAHFLGVAAQAMRRILAPALTSNPCARRRFEREARAASALDHANICTLYDLGESDGRAWLAMACVSYETLAGRPPFAGAGTVDRAVELDRASAAAGSTRAGLRIAAGRPAAALAARDRAATFAAPGS